MRDKAFTLAEVLITLTIIGVIAAITIPNLMRAHMQKELEVAFNKSVALLNQGLSLMAYEEGAGLKQSYATYNKETGLYSGDTDFSNFYNYMKIEKQMYSRDLYAKTGAYKNFNKSNILSQNYFPFVDATRVDKIYVSPGGMTFRAGINSSEIHILVDTNGVKGPNRGGYDYFWFNVSNKDRITYNAQTICSKSDSSADNGLGCSKYALLNKCPWDDSKTYWECLK